MKKDDENQQICVQGSPQGKTRSPPYKIEVPFAVIYLGEGDGSYPAPVAEPELLVSLL